MIELLELASEASSGLLRGRRRGHEHARLPDRVDFERRKDTSTHPERCIGTRCGATAADEILRCAIARAAERGLSAVIVPPA
jgi:hypothetical protein